MDYNFLLGLAIGVIGIIIVYFIMKSRHKSQIHEIEVDHDRELDRTTNTQRSVVKGKVTEQLSPLLPEFAKLYDFGDVRFLGSPIDFVVFKNMSKFNKNSKENLPIEIGFVEIKTGEYSKLSNLQKTIKQSCIDKKIPFDEIGINSNSQNKSE